MMFFANSYFILQLSHAKTFKMKHTKCQYNNIWQSYAWKKYFMDSPVLSILLIFNNLPWEIWISNKSLQKKLDLILKSQWQCLAVFFKQTLPPMPMPYWLTLPDRTPLNDNVMSRNKKRDAKDLKNTQHQILPIRTLWYPLFADAVSIDSVRQDTTQWRSMDHLLYYDGLGRSFGALFLWYPTLRLY